MKTNKLPITLTMVVYNEEGLIERAIKSCCDLVDEIIVVHDGKCHDRTLAIARKYTKRVYVRPHAGESEPNRVFTYQKAQNDWILQLDADEFLSPELHKALPKLIKSNIDIYQFLWLLPDSQLIWSYKTALFRKSKVYFIGAPQEWAKPINKTVKSKKLDLHLIHAPNYNNLTWKVFFKKQIKWAKLQASYYLRDFGSISRWSYDKSWWDFPTNLRLRHPIIFGMLGGVTLNIYYVVKQAIVNRSLGVIRVGVYKSFYTILVFYFFLIGKKHYENPL